MGKQARNQSRELRKGKAAIAGQGRRRNWVFVLGLVVIFVLIITIVVVVAKAGFEKNKPAAISTTGAVVVPAGATADGALVTGKSGAPVTLDTYVDYMCPYCGQFERANGTEIARLVDNGTVLLHLHPLAFLDNASNGTQYSTRAANAVSTVADQAPATMLAFSNALYRHQPKEGSAGLTDQAIADIASNVGVPVATVNAFGARTFAPWVAQQTEAAFSTGGITGTPTVKINGTKFEGDLYTVGPLTKAIMAAAK